MAVAGWFGYYLSGGAVKDPRVIKKVSSVVSRHISNDAVAQFFISKTGNAYLVVTFVTVNFFDEQSAEKLQMIK